MKKLFFRLVLPVLFLWCFLLIPAVHGETAFPAKPATNIYVQDFAGILTPETEARLLEIGYELDQKTTAQLAVVTVNSLENMTVEDFAIGLFREWGIGTKEKNNGVLLLIAPTEGQSRIEVGYGLEGALPDGKTGRIQGEYMLPKFQAGDFDGGTTDGYLTLAGVIAEEYQVQLGGGISAPPLEEEVPANTLPPWLIIVIAVGVLFLVYLDFHFLGGMITWAILSSLRRGGGGGGRGGGGGFGGGGFGGGSSGGGGSSRRW